MSESFEKKKHTASCENRETLEMSGINDVNAFNEEEVTAASDWGDIIIKGSALQVETLDLESGVLKVRGRISAIIYNDKTVVKGFLKRAFSN